MSTTAALSGGLGSCSELNCPTSTDIHPAVNDSELHLTSCQKPTHQQLNLKQNDNSVAQSFNQSFAQTNTSTEQPNGIKPAKPVLAPHPTKINHSWKTRCKGEQQFVEDHIPQFMSYLGTTRNSTKRNKAFDSTIASLVNASRHDKQVLYSRSNSKGNTAVKQTADYLHSQGLVINVLGAANEYQETTSYMIPTPKLEYDISTYDVEIALREDAPMIEVRDSNKKPLSLQRLRTRRPTSIRKATLPVQSYNQLWLEHAATIDDKPLVPFVKRIYNHSLDYGGRFYGSTGTYQSISSEDRQRIKINDKHTVEPDFKAMHFCLLYAMNGIGIDPYQDDPYTIEGYSRATVKLACLVLLNSEDLSRFKANVTNSGNPEAKALYSEYKLKYSEYERKRLSGIQCDKPYKSKRIDGFIEGMPDGIKGDKFLDAFFAKHYRIKNLIGLPNIGLKLQNIDSEIMACALTQCSALNIPVLPVHDSLRCCQDDLETVIGVMDNAYKSVVGFNCYVK